jgi:molybdenum cofactor cytidylyltransferase
LTSPLIQPILLAGGVGRRFAAEADSSAQANKLLALLPNGTPVALQSLQRLQAAFAQQNNAVAPAVIAVVRPDSSALAEALAHAGAQVKECEAAHTGMGATLAHAVRASRHAAGWVIALADMPFVQATTFRAVADALRAGAPLAAPFFQDKRGNPVGLSNEFLAALLALEGDQGAREILKTHAARLVKVTTQDEGTVADIDTPDDLARMAQRLSSQL